MSNFPEPHTHSKNKIEVELDLCNKFCNKIMHRNYATKSDLKNATGDDTSEFAKKAGLASLKSDINELDFDKFEKVPSGLRNLRSKVDKLDVDKSVPAPVDLSDVVKTDVVNKLNMMNWLKKLTIL